MESHIDVRSKILKVGHLVALISLTLLQTQPTFAATTEGSQRESQVLEAAPILETLIETTAKIPGQDKAISYAPLGFPRLEQKVQIPQNNPIYPVEIQEAFDKACFTAFWYIADYFVPERDCSNEVAAQTLLAATQSCFLAGNVGLAVRLQNQARACLKLIEELPPKVID